MEQRPYIRILTLNGGGARCWSTLVVLEHVMRSVRPGVADPLPCEYFHLIVGSEWGGIIAILLGRLRLSIAACFEKLKELKFPYGCGRRLHRIFPGVSRARSRYYRNQFQSWIHDFSPESNGELCFYDSEQDGSTRHALTLVLATDPTSLATPRMFRSYLRGGNFSGPDTDTPIWQVALAAIATPLDLDPVTFAGNAGELGYTCIAASLAGLSNPSWNSLVEARERFLPNSVHTVLNIGSGGKFESSWPAKLSHMLPVVRGMALAKMVIGQVNDAKRTATQIGVHRQILQESTNSSLYYQYFSASTVDTSYYDWSEHTREKIQKRTIEYLEGPDISGQVQAVAKKLLRLQDIPATHDGS
ncbi:FabD/lysophospholipase-like protein, partial [Decorospora gaudefroyi]